MGKRNVPFLGHEGDTIVVMWGVDHAVMDIRGPFNDRRDLQNGWLDEQDCVFVD